MPALLSTAMLIAALVLSSQLAAQNRDHPGLVHLGKGEWGTVEQAGEAGMIQYRGRWFPKKLQRKLLSWERQDNKGLDWEHAYKARTRLYRVKTNLPRFIFELEVRPFLDELATTYGKVFAEEFGLEGKAVKNKDLEIYCGINQYVKHEGRSRNSPGFIRGSAELAVLYEDSDPAQFYSTMFHEGAHQYFLSLLSGAEFPIWVDEALAVYFEGCTYSRATGRISLNHLSDKRLQGAQRELRGATASAEELFMRIPQRQFDAGHYCMAWSFLYYLIHGVDDCGHEELGSFLRAMNGAGSKPLRAVFKQSTRLDLDEISQGWRDYVMRMKPTDAAIRWVSLVVSGEGSAENLRSGDLVLSIDGVGVFSRKDFGRLWPENRRKPVILTVIRGDPGPLDARSPREIIEVTVPPDSPIHLSAGVTWDRSGSLRD